MTNSKPKRYTLTSGAIVETYRDGVPSGEWVRAEDYDALERDCILFNELYHRERQSKLAAQDALQDAHTDLTDTRDMLETIERHASDMKERLDAMDAAPQELIPPIGGTPMGPAVAAHEYRAMARAFLAGEDPFTFDCHYQGAWVVCDKAVCKREQQCARRTSGPRDDRV